MESEHLGRGKASLAVPPRVWGCEVHAGLLQTPSQCKSRRTWVKTYSLWKYVWGDSPCGLEEGSTEGLAEHWGVWGTQPSGLVLGSQPDFLLLSSQGLLVPHPSPTHIGCFFSTGGTDGKGSTSFIHLLRDAFNLPAHSLSSHMTSSHNGCGRGSWAIFLLLGNVSC